MFSKIEYVLTLYSYQIERLYYFVRPSISNTKDIVRLASNLVSAFRTALRLLYFVDPPTLPSDSVHPGKIRGSQLLFGWHCIVNIIEIAFVSFVLQFCEILMTM